MPGPTVFDEDSGSWTHGPAIANVVTDTIDATYGTQEQNVLTDVRTKLDQVLAVLRSAGLIAGD